MHSNPSASQHTAPPNQNMRTLTAEITGTLNSLDPPRAKALERALQEMLNAVRTNAPTIGPVDAQGWPIGY